MVVQRHELVEFSISPPADHHEIVEVLDRLREELGERWQYRQTVKVRIGEDGEILFRYLKART